MDKDEYISSLENLLIFMCQTYEEQEKVLLSLAKEGNRVYFEVPRIQGTANLIPIAQIAEMEFHKPIFGFKEIKDEIVRKRGKR